MTAQELKNSVLQKTIPGKMYLIDGTIDGRVKYTLANWTGLVFKIPRTSLSACKDRPELKQTGAYFLFGKDDQTDENVICVGQCESG